MLSLLPAKYYFAPKINEKNYGKPVPVSELKIQRLQRLDPKNAVPVPALIAKGSDDDMSESDTDVSDDNDESSEVESASDREPEQKQGKRQRNDNHAGDTVETDFQFSKVVTGTEMLAPGKRQKKHILLKKAC